MIRLLIFAGLLFTASTGTAQSIVEYSSYWDNYLITNMTMQSHDLPSDQVYSGMQSSDGFMWLVCATGLVRFDGITTKVYDSRNTSYNGSTLYEIHEDSKGNLWLPTIGEGILRFRDEEFTQFDKSRGLSTDLVKSMTITSGDTLWLGTYGGGIQAFYGDTVVATYTTEDGLVHDQVWRIISDRENRLWIATNGGLSIFENGSFTNFTIEDDLPFNVIRGLTEMDNGDVWAGTDKEGFVIFRDQKPLRHFNLNDGLVDNDPQFFAQNPYDGSVWIAYHGNGIDRYAEGTFESLTPEYGLVSGYTTFINFTEEGLVLVGTEAGISIFKKRKIDVVNTRHGLTENILINVNQDSTGVVWVGTEGKGFNYRNPTGWQSLEFPPEFSNGYAGGASADRQGNIWFNTKGTGTLKIRNFEVAEIYNTENGLLSNFARGLAFDHDNNAWIGTSEGVHQIRENGEILTFTADDGLPGDLILTAISTSDGSIWMGTFGGGVIRFQNEDISVFNTGHGLLSDRVYALLEGQNGNVWIGGASGGLSVYDGNSIFSIGSDAGMPASGLSALVEDDFGNLWAASSRELFRMSMQDLLDYRDGKISAVSYARYTMEDGFPSQTLEIGYTSTAAKLKNGEILFATNHGLGVIDPRKLSDPAPPIKTYIDQITVNGINTKYDESFIIQPGNNKIEISYSAFNFQAPSKTVFRIRLDGIDDEWVDVGNRKTVYYDYLPDGDYTFRVAATNADGQWNYEYAALGFRVSPPFFKSWWFIGFSFLLFFGLSGFSVRYRGRLKMKALNRELAVQHRIQRERERISRDLHDNVGSQITNLITGLEIGNLYIRKNQKEKALSVVQNLDEDARGAIAELRETIWLLDRNEVLISDFENHIRLLVRQQKYRLNDQEILIDNNVTANIILNPAQSLHLLRIMQEALNNTQKHAAASRVQISFKSGGNQLIAIVRDNGKGMDLNDSAETGNGLKNIRYRTREMNGTCEISSEIGKGTTIIISIPAIP